MIARAGSGWQTVLADLSLILFMVTASAVSQAPAERRGRNAAPQLSARSEPLAVWREGAGAPPLRDWLADQGADPRQQLTIVARYTPGGETATVARASALVSEASGAGMHARLTLEPGPPGIAATLAFDAPEAVLARNLRVPGH